MKIISFLSVFVSFASIIQGAPKEDEILHLPGLNDVINFKHYSGFLEGANKDKLHYWFVTSQSNPAKDPVVLWLNGGPGCSSLDGLLNELGPYHVDQNGTNLFINKYSWNKFANVFFLESPKCVGFSYGNDGSCDTDDDAVSLSNYHALQDFFKKFPEFYNNDFFITGESYGGIYVPTLAVRVLSDNETSTPLNLKAFAVGNGLSSYALNDDSVIFFGYYHGLIGTKLWSNILKQCCKKGIPGRHTCNFSESMSPKCQNFVLIASDIIYNEGLNMYNLYGKCIYPKDTNSSSRYHHDKENLFIKVKSRFAKLGLGQKKLTLDPPCTDSSNMRKYLNSEVVKKALHIPEGLPDWDICSNIPYKRIYSNMRQQYQYLLKRIPGMIYNGDIDMACNFLGDEWFADDLGLEVVQNRKMWFLGNQVAGFWKKYANLDLVTIRGAGHMVPQDKPAVSLLMFQKFLSLGSNRDSLESIILEDIY